MDDELRTLSRRQSDLKHSASLIGSDQHREVIEFEHSDGVPVGVEHVLIGHAVPASAGQDNRVHQHQYILMFGSTAPRGRRAWTLVGFLRGGSFRGRAGGPPDRCPLCPAHTARDRVTDRRVGARDPPSYRQDPADVGSLTTGSAVQLTFRGFPNRKSSSGGTFQGPPRLLQGDGRVPGGTRVRLEGE